MISGLSRAALAAIIPSNTVACPRDLSDGHATLARSLTAWTGPLSIAAIVHTLLIAYTSARREGGTEMDAKPEVHSDLKTKMVVSGLNFYYGDTPASEGGYAAFLHQSGNGPHRSVRLREIDVVARDKSDV